MDIVIAACTLDTEGDPTTINPTWGLIEVLVAWRSAPPLSKVFE
jgi:hypothetical protein